MARFKMGNKSVVTQSGDDEPVVASNVDFSSATFPAGHVIQTVFDEDYGTERATSNNTVLADLAGKFFSFSARLEGSDFEGRFFAAETFI